jgi:hypothetical protein
LNTFEIPEMHQVATDWAFARTNSAGTVNVHSTPARGPEANQELFVSQKVGAAWKIARYCFSHHKPAPHLKSRSLA